MPRSVAVLPTLRAPRLVLRHVRADDAEALFAIFGDEQVARYWGHPRLPHLDAARGLAAEIHRLAAAGTLLQWGIQPDGSPSLVGTCTLAGVDPVHRRAELGVALAPGAQGRGYAQEAVRALLGYAFGALGLHRVWADVDPRNAPALRLLERLGFIREGRLREHHHQSGEWQDGVLYGLLDSEWKE